jgi:hypothetical protein
MQVNLADGGTETYNVTVDGVVVLRELIVSQDSTDTGDTTFALALGLDANVVFWQFPPGWTGTRRLELRTVLDPGDSLVASYANGGGLAVCHVQLSGYVLVNP